MGQKSERRNEMAYHEQHFVKIPKDISLIRQKFMFGLTKRQCIAFGLGIAIGFPSFYVFNSLLGLQAGCFALGFTAAPFVFCGLFKKNGLFFEQIVKLMIEFFKKPKKRTYQSENTFEMLARQIEYDELKKAVAVSSQQNGKK